MLRRQAIAIAMRAHKPCGLTLVGPVTPRPVLRTAVSRGALATHQLIARIEPVDLAKAIEVLQSIPPDPVVSSSSSRALAPGRPP